MIIVIPTIISVLVTILTFPHISYFFLNIHFSDKFGFVRDNIHGPLHETEIPDKRGLAKISEVGQIDTRIGTPVRSPLRHLPGVLLRGTDRSLAVVRHAVRQFSGRVSRVGFSTKMINSVFYRDFSWRYCTAS